MISVGIIVPSWRYFIDPLKLQPLWELYYATLLEERDPEVSVEITDLRHENVRDDYSVIPEKDIYLYWVMKSADSPEVNGIVEYLRKSYPNTVHIAGGTHVDNCPEESAAVFDTIIKGTGEESLISAIADFKRKDLKKSYVSNMPTPFKNYSHARRDFLPATTIASNKHFAQYNGELSTTAYLSRGCSFRCDFCVYNWPPKFELRTPEQITHELEYLKREYHIEAINLKDEVSIPVNKNDAIACLEAIGNAGIAWRGQTIPVLSEELVSLAKQSGCVELAIGLENVVSDEVLQISNLKKNPGVEKSREFIHLLKKYGIHVKVCLVFGLPGEPKDVVAKTIAFLEDTQPEVVALSAMDPVPGSPIFVNKEKYGIKSIGADLSKHWHLVYRFGDKEEVGLPFEYEETTQWGKSLTQDEILGNIRELQQYLREKGMVY
jgi:radical SAM superfamily enzyme YgiQ (UPF0313 family)